MGCKHYFVADRFEALVDEGDSRYSSRAHEHEISACFTTVCGNPDTLKSMSISSSWCDQCPPAGRTVLSRSASTSLSVSMSFSRRSTNKLVFSQSRETCIDFLSTRTGRLFCHNRSPCSKNWIKVGWEPAACRATSGPNSFIQSCFKEVFGGGKGDSYTFSYMTSPVSI